MEWLGSGYRGSQQCYERAAYVAHAITACHSGLPRLLALSDAASSTVCFHADASCYDFTSEKLPPKNCSRRSHDVAWHICGSLIRGYVDEDEAKASQRFHQLKGGPYSGAVRSHGQYSGMYRSLQQETPMPPYSLS